MPRLIRLTVVLLTFIFAITFLPNIVFAGVTGTPTPAPGRPTCDLCGWCNRFATPPAPSPQSWDECNLCLYEADNTEKLKSYYTIAGCIDTNTGAFVKKIISIVVGVSGGLAFLSFLYGSGMVLVSSGNPERIKSGKDILTSSLLGIILIVFSILILKIVGYDILKIPWLGG